MIFTKDESKYNSIASISKFKDNDAFECFVCKTTSSTGDTYCIKSSDKRVNQICEECMTIEFLKFLNCKLNDGNRKSAWLMTRGEK